MGKIACTGALKEPQERNLVGFTQLPSFTVYARPPTSDDHNFLVRAPFWVVLDSMESPLSLEINMQTFSIIMQFSYSNILQSFASNQYAFLMHLEKTFQILKRE